MVPKTPQPSPMGILYYLPGGPSSPESSPNVSPQLQSTLKQSFLKIKSGDDIRKIAKDLVESLKTQGELLENKQKEAERNLAGLLYEAQQRSGLFAHIESETEFEAAVSKAINGFAKKFGKTQSSNANRVNRHFCFPKGTLITMADESQKPIEGVRSGDYVLTCDPNTEEKECVKGRADGAYSAVVSEYYLLNRTLLGITGSDSIYARKNGQELWTVNDPEYAKLKDYPVLQQGDEVFSRRKGWIPVTSIEKIREETQVFNFKQVLPHHTFFAGGVLAHNSGAKVSFMDCVLVHNLKKIGLVDSVLVHNDDKP